MTKIWKVSPEAIFTVSPVIPVLVVENIDQAMPLAKALIDGGIRVLEVTLRTEVALQVIEKIAKEIPEALVGAGTVTNEQQLRQVSDAGAKFAISPGSTRELLLAGNNSSIALIPGVSSTSELMKGLDQGYSHFKFFPAEASGGAEALKSISGPFPNVVFCPTGGINQANYRDYLALPNVHCVGGSWLVPAKALESQDWQHITALAKQVHSV